MKKKISMLMCLVLTAAMAASCGKKEEQKTVNESDYSVDFDDYKDSEDIPSWTGDKIEVTVWQDVNSTEAYVRLKQSKDDVVTPEYERITGVTFDPDNSFDNGGNSYDAKITQLIAANDYPAMAYSLPELSELVKMDALYDLTPYIEKYCPNIMKYFGPDTVYGTVWESQKEKYGGMYALPTGENINSVKDMVKKDGSYDLTDEQIQSICGPGSTPHGYVWVRDDILKMIYPTSHTYDELQEIFEKNGKFTEEEIFDVPWDTPQDFIDFLYKANKLQIPDDGKGRTYTIYTHNGTDNWAACTTMLPMFGYSGDYFDYYDIQENKLKLTYKEDWFKNILKTYNQLVRDGVASSEALIDTQQNFNEKMSNGRYFVSILTYPPTGNATNEYKYRKVYAKYTNGWSKCLNIRSSHDSLKKISFFKKGISEANLIQVLRAVDFSVSAPGQKLIYWGPKSAGLYTEDENGNLQYTSEELKNSMIDWDTYGRDIIEKYGLKCGPWPGRPYPQASMYSPKAYYNSTLTMEAAFNAAYVDPIEYPIYGGANFYSADYTAQLPGAKKFWQSRNAFEDSLTQVFAAENDTQFEERYKAMCDLAERNGLTDDTLAEYQKLYNENNKIYEGNIEAFMEENSNRAK